MSANPKIDPEEFTDAEVIKEKLDKVIEGQRVIMGHLEKLVAALGVLTSSEEAGGDSVCWPSIPTDTN